MERFGAYGKFVAGHYPHLKLDESATFGACREINGITLTISGLNSAWTCADAQDKNQLWLAGEAQVTLAGGLSRRHWPAPNRICASPCCTIPRIGSTLPRPNNCAAGSRTTLISCCTATTMTNGCRRTPIPTRRHCRRRNHRREPGGVRLQPCPTRPRQGRGAFAPVCKKAVADGSRRTYTVGRPMAFGPLPPQATPPRGAPPPTPAVRVARHPPRSPRSVAATTAWKRHCATARPD